MQFLREAVAYYASLDRAQRVMTDNGTGHRNAFKASASRPRAARQPLSGREPSAGTQPPAVNRASRRRQAAATAAKPVTMRAQVEASGTGWVTGRSL